MGNFATKAANTNFVEPTNFVRIKEDEAAKGFAAVVIDFDAATLSRVSGRHIETAKLWKAGKRCPNSSSLINLMTVIPEIRSWVDGEVASRQPSMPVDARSGYAALALLQQEAMQPGDRGALARAMLAKLSKGGA